MERMGQVIGIKAERLHEYRRLHAEAWPEVCQGLAGANIHNYSIFLVESELLMFSYREYSGDGLAVDMQQLQTLPRMKDWSDLCGPMQRPLPFRQEGEWWARIEEIFHSP